MDVAKEATATCKQWDFYDCHRTPKAELDLYEGGEPRDVEFARVLMNIAQIGLYEVIQHDTACETSKRVGPLFASCEDAYRFIKEIEPLKSDITKCPDVIFGVQVVSVALPGDQKHGLHRKHDLCE